MEKYQGSEMMLTQTSNLFLTIKNSDNATLSAISGVALHSGRIWDFSLVQYDTSGSFLSLAFANPTYINVFYSGNWK